MVPNDHNTLNVHIAVEVFCFQVTQNVTLCVGPKFNRDQKFNCWISQKNSIMHNYRLNGRWCLFCSLFISENKRIQENWKTSHINKYYGPMCDVFQFSWIGLFLEMNKEKKHMYRSWYSMLYIVQWTDWMSHSNARASPRDRTPPKTGQKKSVQPTKF